MTQKTYNKKDVEKILRANGWTYDRASGGHLIYKGPNGKGRITLPLKVNKMMFRRLMKENNLKEVC